MISRANDPSKSTWLDVPSNSDFSVQNIPFGVFHTSDKGSRCATRIGDTIIDLSVLADKGYLKGLSVDPKVWKERSLNAFMKGGKEGTREVRERLSDLFTGEDDSLKKDEQTQQKAFFPVEKVEMDLPVEVGDYTDFYSSKEHATNVGTMFRDPDNALMPNWVHLPVAYHGRASSIIPTGVPIHRPKGQQKPDDSDSPVFGPCKLLDFELEMGFITYQGKPLGDRISTEEASDHIFGLVLFNDWSARDIQKWEYQPLGPFLAKSFASSISPWVVTLDALEPFRTSGPKQEPEVLPYLQYEGDKNLDIGMQVYVKPDRSEPKMVCNSNHKYLYWNMEQQLAHHTVNGCNLRVGDMMASGTISGPEKESFGSMLEQTWKGQNPIQMPDGSERKFLKDGDTVIMTGAAEKEGVRVGFGEVRTKVLPAKE